MSSPFHVWDWEWDRVGGTVNGSVSITRWRRGPVTFYRYRVDFGAGEARAKCVVWGICPWDNVVFYFVQPKLWGFSGH